VCSYDDGMGYDEDVAAEPERMHERLVGEPAQSR
jgi:hypothetical protein